MSTSTLIKLSAFAASFVSLVGFSTLFGVESSYASIVNGGFETGNFDGWQTLGDTSIETSAFGSGPKEGDFQALLRTSSINDFQLESFLGLPSGSLDALGNGDATEGSAIKQTFTAKAGQVVKFHWNFLTDELDFDDDPFSFNDFAFVSLTSLNELGDTSLSFMNSLTEFSDETGFEEFSYVIPTTGTYSLGIGVTDVDNRIFESGLLVDKVAVTPEPASVLGLLAVSVLGAGSAFKRKQQRKA
ncbi:MAG: PEP-CTERM sorting domain-containing protein [Coleofasciculus sp. B1-GNL1-01]|uniref:PEP-CTERM sorting domain-containing protein n=1 Tax=Coleofasciculus sp. B1-GNL1-01 TaxID=3068484 RepID=UPI003302EA79